ncbi:PAS domain-containing protein [Scytonema hofmannii FACHB-248]|uniref:histidine kinase n=2 Tax=Nostocales TaxID=1161 RepID=A0ABR8GMH6_9CYAN|nr:ATP-binding protein [Scytonema hofmannii]MBD2604617.1 PAS domain-containing protein [Scytonema hofmannii FACHB-248]
MQISKPIKEASTNELPLRVEKMAQKQRSILILDDCHEDRKTFCRYLHQAPNYIYSVVESEFGEEALKLCNILQPDCVLVDYSLPDMDGIEFLEKLRNTTNKVDIAVVMVTACGNEAIAVEAMKKGATDYLSKEKLTAENLLSTVTHALEKVELLWKLNATQEQLKFQAYILSQVTDAVMVTEGKLIDQMKARIVYVNAAFTYMTGYTAEEVLGKTPSILNKLTTDPKVIEQINQAIANSQPVKVELINYRKDGSEFWSEINITPMLDEVGECTNLIFVQRDISEQQAALRERKLAEVERQQMLTQEKAYRAEAEASNRTKDQFLAIISHELRSPLNAILGWTKLIQGGKLDDLATVRALKTIERNAKLQNELIQDLLDFSRITEGKLRLELCPVDLTQIINAAIDVVRPSADSKSIVIESRLEFTVGEVLGDSSRLQQVMWNLLTNAVKFTPDGGQIAIWLKRVEYYAQIIVSDTGVGISPDFLPNVFEQFCQADSQYTARHKGLGLGLAIVRSLVEMHNGTVTAASDGEGQGATFTVRLPLNINTTNSANTTAILGEENPHPNKLYSKCISRNQYDS